MEGMYTFHRDRSRADNRSLRIVSIIFVLILVLDIATSGAIRGLVRTVLLPVQIAMHGVGESILSSDFLVSKATLEAENATLSQRVVDLTAENLILQQQSLESSQIAMISRNASSSGTILAHIISSPLSSPYGTVLIDAGAMQGVVPKMEVIDRYGGILGVIDSVAANSSVMSQVSASGQAIEAEVGGIPITVHGRGGSTLGATIPRGTNITIGQPVIALQYHRRIIGVVVAIGQSMSSADVPIVIGTPHSLLDNAVVAVVPL